MMKKLAIAALLLLMTAMAFADAYTIGTGTAAASTLPFNGLWDYSWSKVIYTQAEINAAGLTGAASFSGIGFYVGNAPSNYTMLDQRVYARLTNMALYDTADNDHPDFNNFQFLFQGDLTYNGGGWYYIVFTAPFAWDGNQNIEFLFENWDADYITGYPTFRYTSTTPDYLAVYKSQDNSFPAGLVGTRTYNRPNIQLVTPTTTPPDPAVLVGPANGGTYVALQPTFNWMPGNIWPDGYRINIGTDNPPANILSNVDLGNVSTYTHPTPFAHETTIYWQLIPYNTYGNATDCPVWSFTTHPDGFVTIGEGNQNALMPFNFYYKSSLHQALYLENELGFTTGTITAMKLYNQFTTNISNTPVKIWMGSTAQTDLSGGYIPSTEMSLVFDGTINLPSGANDITIVLDTPYMHTPGNLAVMFFRPLDGQYYASTDYFKCQTIGTTRARNTYSDSIVYDPAAPPAGTLTGQFAMTSFIYQSEAIVNDLGCQGISGNVTPSEGTASPYTITIKNNGSNPQTNYQVKLMKEGDVELVSVAGPAIASMETIPVVINWTPTTIGPTFIYGKVVLANDEIPQNNQTAPLNIVVQASGTVAITVGAGGSTARMPVDMFYKNSIFQTIYQANEMNIGGLLTAIQFYNSFSSNIPNKPIKIWAGETDLSDLSAAWIPSTEMTLVFDGNVDFPTGQNDILIPLDTPFVYGGGNLAVMVLRPTDTQYYASADNFVTQTGTVTGRTRILYSDTVAYDPAAPPTATPSAAFPKTTFMFITQGMGSLSGTVYGPGNTPLEGATVSIANSTISFTTGMDGSYSFPYLAQGTHQVTATKHGYTSATHTVTITEDQNTTQNFTLAMLDNVTVTGRIVGSDHPNIGLADAIIELTGYAPYSATTNAQGQFTIPNVFANHTYQYLANAEGYAPTTGEVVVGNTNVNMGDVIVNEVAFPPSQVIATENIAQTQVSLIWNSPTAAPPYDDFEMNDGGWIPTATWDPVGDWEWTNNYNVANFVDTYGSASVIPPPACYSGTGMWGTKINTNYTNSGGSNYLTKTFNLAGINNPELRFWSWENVFGDFDYCQVKVNGSLVWGPSWQYTNTQWTERVINLSAYAGMSNVEITLEMYATTVVNYAGWYIDDVYVGPAQTRSITSAPSITPTWQIGLSETQAASKAEEIAASNPVISTQPRTPSRTMDGYKVWRLLSEDENNENLWTLLTNTAVTDTTYTDTAWQPLPSGVYKYAVKAVYTNDVMSAPAFSNMIHKGMMGTLSGTVTEFGTNIPIAGAIITAGEYSGTSGADGSYTFLAYQDTYTVTCAKPGYQTASQTGVVIVGMQTTTQNFVLTEITLPPGNVVAEEINNVVNITWSAPGTAGGEWLHYDSGSSNNSIGTGAAADFDVAIRFPASALTDYAGMSLYAVKAWPAQAGTFSIRVWTGGSAAAPATQVVDQPFTPNLDSYNTVILNNPVTITGSEELWFGYRCNVTEGYPAGCDEGPAIDGFGNMMYFQGEWSTLLELAASLNYNWCIQGYAGYSAPTDAPMITMPDVNLKHVDEGPRLSIGALSAVSAPKRLITKSLKPQITDNSQEPLNRALTGYKAWRLQQGQEGSENTWVALTPDAITATAYQDTGFNTLADGTYKWAVKAIYTGGAMSPPAFSNAIILITQIGTVAGIVRNVQNAPISGAIIRCGTSTATTNASGAYSMQVVAGTHTVTASHPNYATATVNNVVVMTGQTTTLNFQLQEAIIIFEDGFETYENFSIDFAPWTNIDVDGSGTYGITGTTWLNYYDPQAFIIFVPSATSPAITSFEPHGGLKVAACFAAVMPAQGGNGPNDDWLITPPLTGAGEINFWARSFTAQYGLERFKVGYSTTLNPADFSIVSGDNYLSAPAEWTEYAYPIPATSGPIYIGIHCVSNDAFFFMVDDVTVTGGTDADDPEIPVVQTTLNANYPNPFNPETTISYSLAQSSAVTIEIYNVKGQLVKTLVKDTKAAGHHSIVWNGKDNNNRSVSSGIYYYKMSAGKYSSTRKMILMK